MGSRIRRFPRLPSYVAVVVALLVKWLFGAGTARRSAGGARDILAERYARGEIDREEFEQKSRDLSA
jgi:putative membrane protein